MSQRFTGGCLCGAVRYECTARPLMAGHCQCTDCRKSSGTGHASAMAVPESTVSFKGEVKVYESIADSGNRVSRVFCPVCGSPVYSLNSGMLGLVFLKASSLDDVEVFTPQVVVYAKRAASWDVVDRALPRFDAMPPAEAMTPLGPAPKG